MGSTGRDDLMTSTRGRDRLPVPVMDDSGFCGHDSFGGPDLYSAVETEPS